MSYPRVIGRRRVWHDAMPIAAPEEEAETATRVADASLPMPARLRALAEKHRAFWETEHGRQE